MAAQLGMVIECNGLKNFVEHIKMSIDRIAAAGKGICLMPRRIADISDFFNIDGGDEIEVGGRFYKITGHEKERRFGIEDPKFWVKRAIDIENGERKIIKFAFFESFEITLGGVKIRCYRNPEKEGEILGFMRGHPLFMQGEVFRDHKENNIRVLDIVRGTNLYVKLDNLVMDHQTYFETVMPDLLSDLLPTLTAIRELHMRGYRHGDIRSDHIVIEHSVPETWSGSILIMTTRRLKIPLALICWVWAISCYMFLARGITIFT
jgi:hypothetical protein